MVPSEGRVGVGEEREERGWEIGSKGLVGSW